MSTPREAKHLMLCGAWFQFPMFGTYMAMLGMYHALKNPAGDIFSPWFWVSNAGSCIFLYCLVILYVKRKRLTELVTDGPFRYTRHPMYTGLVLMDTIFLLPGPASSEPLFFILQATFFCCLVIAAYFQEKETLARFGREAEEYYARTPRLFFMYPFTRGRLLRI